MRSFPKTCAALALSAALAGCAQTDTAPVWQAVLPAGGAAVSIANCTVTESTALYTDAEGETTEISAEGTKLAEDTNWPPAGKTRRAAVNIFNF